MHTKDLKNDTKKRDAPVLWGGLTRWPGHYPSLHLPAGSRALHSAAFSCPANASGGHTRARDASPCCQREPCMGWKGTSVLLLVVCSCCQGLVAVTP